MSKVDANDILRSEGAEALRGAFDRAQTNGAALGDEYQPLGGAPQTLAKPHIIRPPELQGKSAPERRWIVPNWIPRGVVTGLYGDGGLGKTLLAQQLQTATALARPWIGQFAEPVKSLGIYCEDEFEELWRRQEDLTVSMNPTLPILETWNGCHGLARIISSWCSAREALASLPHFMSRSLKPPGTRAPAW